MLPSVVGVTSLPAGFRQLYPLVKVVLRLHLDWRGLGENRQYGRVAIRSHERHTPRSRCGFIMSNETFGDVIFSYSRAQAIADGVLVDLTPFQVVRQHWKFHFACTDAVWAIVTDAVEKHGKDCAGILHDISTLAKQQIRSGRNEEALLFQVIIGPSLRSLKLHCGPGDRAEPVLTLMLPTED